MGGAGAGPETSASLRPELICPGPGFLPCRAAMCPLLGPAPLELCACLLCAAQPPSEPAPSARLPAWFWGCSFREAAKEVTCDSLVTCANAHTPLTHTTARTLWSGSRVDGSEGLGGRQCP